MKSGISLLTPLRPETQDQRLPPMLRIIHHIPMSSCSEAPRGLFVLVWVVRILTDCVISPSLSLRQCSSRSTIRAGRNLPDKEFRYLRTVIVTAAIHQGLCRKLLSRSR